MSDAKAKALSLRAAARTLADERRVLLYDIPRYDPRDREAACERQLGVLDKLDQDMLKAAVEYVAALASELEPGVRVQGGPLVGDFLRGLTGRVA